MYKELKVLFKCVSCNTLDLLQLIVLTSSCIYSLVSTFDYLQTERVCVPIIT